MITIEKSNEVTTEQWELLLLADPSKKMVESYIYKSEVYVARNHENLIGIIVLTENDLNEVEIKNIAVNPINQGRGYGKKLINFAISESKRQGYKKLIICTGNSSIHQLAVYQNCGFQSAETIQDFFVKNYDDEIWENGIQCRDLIKLELILIQS